MDRVLPSIITVVVVLGVLALMWRSWRKRSRRDAALEAGYPAPATEDTRIASARSLYVATTPRGNPLERLAIRGLGFRARAQLTVSTSGVSLALAGEDPVFIPADVIDVLTPATWTIDRVVEPDGLLLLGWRLKPSGPDLAQKDEFGIAVDSYFRVIDPFDRGRIVDAIRSIAGGAGDAGGPTSSNESEA